MEPYQLVLIGGSGLLLGTEILRNRVGIRLPDDLAYVDDDQSRESGEYNHFHSLLSAAERAGVEPRLLRPLEPELLRSAGVAAPRIADAWRDASSLLLGTLFTKTELEADLRSGFFADPKLGASCCIASNSLEFLAGEIQSFGGRPERGIRHRIIAGSVAGGTGAGILPALARRLRPAAYAPHYDGRHLHVLAFLPWMNPEKAAALAKGPIRPTWQGCARNAVGGLRSLQRLVFDVEQQNNNRPAGAGQPVETFVYPLGVPVAEAEAKAPPTVAEVRSRGSADDVFMHAVLALPRLLAPRDAQVPPGGAHVAALHSPLLPPDARAAEATMSPIHEVDMGMWHALERMGGNPDRKIKGWVLERVGWLTFSSWALPEPLFRIVSRASDAFKHDPVEGFFKKIKTRWSERARHLEAWVKKQPPRLEPNLSRFEDDAVLRRAIEEQLDGKTIELLCRCADCDKAGDATQTANADHIADVIADAVRQYFLVRANEAASRASSGEGPLPGGRILPLGTPSEAVVADRCGRSLFRQPAGAAHSAADVLATTYANTTGEPGVYSRPFASPLGVAHAMLHRVRDAMQEHRAGDRARLLTDRGVSLVIALWRAAFHNQLTFDSITPRDREIIAAGEPAAVLADCRVVRFNGAAVGLTFPELGLVPHVELVDQERSAEGLERLRTTLASEALQAQLSKLDEMPDRIAFRRYLDELRPSMVMALAELPVGQRSPPIWYQLLDRWAGTDLPAETTVHCVRRVTLWPAHAEASASFQSIPVRRSALSAFTTSDGTHWRAPGVVADRLGDGYAELELEVVRYEIGRAVCTPVWAGDARVEVDLPLLPGVCIASRAVEVPVAEAREIVPGDVQHAVYVWDGHAHTSWDGASRVLRLIGRIEGRPEVVTFAVRFGADFDLQVLSNDRVLVKRVARVRAFEQGREGWVYADVPVRAEFLHLVRSASAVVGPAARVYTVNFLGEVTREVGYGEGQTADIGRPKSERDVGKTVAIAVWPGLGIPPVIRRSWRLFTFLFGDNGVNDVCKEYKANFGVFGGLPDRNPMFCRLDRPDDVAPVRTVVGPPTPRFLHVTILDEGGGEGTFSLDPLGVGAETADSLPPAYLGLDLGTSNTCMAATSGQAPQLLRFAGEEAHRPHVLARNVGHEVDLGLLTSEPWLPSVRCVHDRPECRASVAPFSELPTWLMLTSRYAVDGKALSNEVLREEGVLPFADFCLVGPEVNTANWGSRVLSGIKWGHSPEKTRRFLEVLFVWGLASPQTYGNEVVLRASFPLAFRAEARARYGAVIAEALRRATEWTGRRARLDAPLDAPALDYTRSMLEAAPVPALPFLDESSVLVEGIGKIFKHHGHTSNADGRTLSIAVAIDIGGRTIDTVVAALKPGAGDGLNSRLLSAGSVELGADVLKRRLLQDVFQVGGFASILDLAIRTGLPRRMWSTEGWPGAGDLVTTHGEAVNSLPLAWKLIRGYFGVLAEYCARVLAGALLDRQNLIHRLKSARGTGAQEAFETEVTWLSNSKGPVRIVLAPLLCGNGWRWLPTDERSAWASLFASRARELLSAYDERARAGGEWAPYDASLVSLDATTWPKGKVAALLAGVQRLTRNPAPVPPESVCNGFAVEPEHEERWMRQIGAGALPASDAGSKELYGAIWDRCDPPSAHPAPTFPRSVTLGGAVQKVELANRSWQLPSAADFKAIREAQAERKDHAEFRSLSTMDAWLGRVLAAALDDQWFAR